MKSFMDADLLPLEDLNLLFLVENLSAILLINVLAYFIMRARQCVPVMILP